MDFNDLLDMDKRFKLSPQERIDLTGMAAAMLHGERSAAAEAVLLIKPNLFLPLAMVLAAGIEALEEKT